MDLEQSSISAAHWSKKQYESQMLNGGSTIFSFALVAERRDDSATVGFLIARGLGPQWELENIVVAGEMQGKGIGTRLMQALLDRAKQANSEAVFLEVRESNEAARALYEKLGFQEVGRRKSYYSNPLEDAVLYRKTLP